MLAASNGIEAFELVERHKVNLIFSDVEMLYCNGFQLLKRIRTKNSYDPIVMLQTGDITIDLEKVFLLGAEGIHFKPFHSNNVLTAIHSYVPPAGGRWRRFGRHSVDLHAEIFLNQEKSEWRNCTTLARGGMFVEGNSATNESERCQFNLYESRGSPTIPILQGTGIVTRKKISGFAVEFTEQSQRFVQGIAKIIVQRPSFHPRNLQDVSSARHEFASVP